MSDKPQAYEGEKLIQGSDLPRGVVFEFEIESVAEPGTLKDARGVSIDKRVLFLRKDDKDQLIINKTSETVITSQHGKPDKWPGKTIRIERRYLEKAFGKENVMCVRVLPPKGEGATWNVLKHLGSPKPYEGVSIDE